MVSGMLDRQGVERLRSALQGYTVDGVHERLGPVGQAALSRGDVRGLVRNLSGADPLAVLLRLFLAGVAVPTAEAADALAPLGLDAATAAGLVERSGDSVRALVDVRPYAERRGDDSGSDWWIVSDFGAEVRGGPLRNDHVPGVGAASLTLAGATPRHRVERALDVGTGCGIQALHLSGHAAEVVATDISDRALRMAATTAALSGQAWDLRRGSLLEPVAGETFDLVVANPPFVVSAGGVDFDYRDGGLAGDGISAALVRGIPRLLDNGGTGQLLANWQITADRTWEERLASWLAGSGCDAWVWQREVAEPAEYVALWLRDAGEQPGTPSWTERYDAWLDWFERSGTVGVGMGLATLWRTGADSPTVVCEDVPQALEQPIGAQLPAWHARQRWLREADDRTLLAAPVGRADGVVLDRSAVPGPAGWEDVAAALRQTSGMRWRLEIDASMTAVVAGCDGRTPLGRLLDVLAAVVGEPPDAVAEAALPVVRDLVARGFLLPPELR